MAVDVSGFRARFPEFSAPADYPDARIQLMLDDAALQINRGAWGIKADLGTYYLAAHNLVIQDPAAAVTPPNGSVQSESVGEVSRSYAVSLTVSSNLGDFAWTRYGFLYDRLKRQILGTPVVL